MHVPSSSNPFSKRKIPRLPWQIIQLLNDPGRNQRRTSSLPPSLWIKLQLQNQANSGPKTSWSLQNKRQARSVPTCEWGRPLKRAGKLVLWMRWESKAESLHQSCSEVTAAIFSALQKVKRKGVWRDIAQALKSEVWQLHWYRQEKRPRHLCAQRESTCSHVRSSLWTEGRWTARDQGQSFRSAQLEPKLRQHEVCWLVSTDDRSWPASE